MRAHGRKQHLNCQWAALFGYLCHDHYDLRKLTLIRPPIWGHMVDGGDHAGACRPRSLSTTFSKPLNNVYVTETLAWLGNAGRYVPI